MLCFSACGAPSVAPRATPKGDVASKAAPKSDAPLTAFEEDGRYGYRDASGVVIGPRYDVAMEFTKGGIAAVADKDGWHIIDREGTHLMTPFIFDNGPDDFVEGLARFVEDGKIGFHDENGSVVIAARFDFVRSFEGGKARACDGCESVADGEHSKLEGGQWFWIDAQGRRIDEAP